jgi:hypothetical protein
MIIYNNSRHLPKDYSISKIISKVSQSYNNFTEQSDNIGIRAVFDAREAILADLGRLTPSDYTVKIPKSLPLAPLGDGTVSSSFDIESAKEVLEKEFVKKYPNLKLFKGLFFSLDSKLDTLKFIQQVLIKTIRYSFYPLVFVTLYIYFVRITG